MRHVLLVVVLAIFSFNSSLNAMNCMRSIGQSLDTINLPVIGKLTNILPFGIVATSFKEYPGQTMLLVAGLLAYILSQNQSVRELFEKYKETYLPSYLQPKDNDGKADETLFIFDGEDEDDAEDEMEIEDELLDDGSGEKKVHRPTLNFL